MHTGHRRDGVVHYLALKRCHRRELLALAAKGDEEAQKLVAEDPLLAEGAEGRARIPFGPFLILACLELLLAGDWIFAKISSWIGLES